MFSRELIQSVKAKVMHLIRGVFQQVDLGWYSHGEQLEHWYEIMEHPHRAADMWHPIIKTGKIAS